ncbi:uncharacterized protein LOC124672364 [Lolium rigidum]|uniref:uncharacterized protein LOC124672364 n=1 Tax=Lolium rigidum TaxID=89674 RepID=UPI001F5D00EC|nr:uncharacterized protein LOC124672364 [Lolium rigidum]
MRYFIYACSVNALDYLWQAQPPIPFGGPTGNPSSPGGGGLDRDASSILHLAHTHQPSTIRAISSAAGGMLRARLRAAAHVCGGHGDGAGRWTTPGHEVRPKGYPMNRTPPPPGESRKWEDWELPCYLTVVILGVGLNAKPDLTIETWAHQRALERLQQQELAVSADALAE